MLRKRIEKDKAKDQQAKLEQRVENLRNLLSWRKLRQRVLVLQSDLQAPYDQAGERKPSQDPDTDGTDVSNEEKSPLEDSDGF